MTLRSRLCRAAIPLFLGLAAGCGDAESDVKDVPILYADPKPAARANAGDDSSKDGASSATTDSNVLRTGPYEKSFEGIRISVPKGWQEVKLSGNVLGFVDARFVIPTKAGGPVELTCLSSGGGIDENVTRWVGQFDIAADGRKVETIRVGGADAKWVDLRGTFNGKASGRDGPHPKWRMLGAAIPVGERGFFLKLNGPEDDVAEIHEAFRDLVKSAKVEE